MPEKKRYDRAYFDKWYRHPKFRVKSAIDVERQLRFVVAATEYLFERPVRRVLDVGAGEGNWGVALKRIRPRASYVGVDASEYAVARYGASRNVQLGSLGDVGNLRLGGPFDLVLCCGVLIYIPPDELRTGLRQLRVLTRGVAYLEVFTNADDASGDFRKRDAKSPQWWRRLIGRAGFVSCGMHLWIPEERAGVTAALERAE
jgi:SAM-dependent methyltransferase